jgi:hypothetical protein
VLLATVAAGTPLLGLVSTEEHSAHDPLRNPLRSSRSVAPPGVIRCGTTAVVAGPSGFPCHLEQHVDSPRQRRWDVRRRVRSPALAKPRAIAAGDVNGGGFPDVFVLHPQSETVACHRNNGVGTLARGVEYRTGAGPESVLLGDLDGDGLADIAAANDYMNFDSRGRLVRELADRAHAFPGRFGITWDGRDGLGRRVSSGVYHVQLSAAGTLPSRRVVVLR